jgi:hypothetical protein
MLLGKLSSRRYSKYLWRSLVFIGSLMVLLFLQAHSVMAAPLHDGEGVVTDTSIIALDKLCIDGIVIDHQEKALSGWTVTATYIGTDVQPAPQTSVSNADGQIYFALPNPGHWLFSLAVPPDWIALTPDKFDVNVQYGQTLCEQIRFKVQQQITVIVYKIDEQHTPLAGWTIIATPGKDNTFSEVHQGVTDAQGVVTFTLTSGLWIFSEAAPEGTQWWEPVIPLNGVQQVDVKAPGPYTIRFKNKVKKTENGCIEVTKEDVPPPNADGSAGQSFGLPDWPIRVLRADDSVADAGKTDAFGKITFHLPFGPYVVEEDMLHGWEAAGPTQYQLTLSPSDSGCKQITFKNKQTVEGFCIEGMKVDDGMDRVYGIAGWTIDAQPTRKGDINPDPVVTDGQGKFRIDFPLDDYRVPGSTYQISEETRDGWTPNGPTVQTVTLPKYPGSCVVVPPFVNRQTNNSYTPPQTSRPHGGGHGHQDQGSWQPPHDPGPGGCSTYHTVTRGESISSIASQYHMNGGALMQANPWVYSQYRHWLYTGQQVCIP